MLASKRHYTRAVLLFMLVLVSASIHAQNNTPNASDQGLFTLSPDAASLSGSGPVSLATGAAATAIPIYEVKCGSLSLPISLGYSYNGFDPVQEASWAGFGWNLIAGGMIGHNVQSASDNTRNSGKNYGQYNIHDSLFQSNNANFIHNIYTNARDTSYDTGPDIYQCNFNGNSGTFYWYNNKQYFLSYTKQFNASWSSGTQSFTLTTSDGTSYNFGQIEQTSVFFPVIHWIIYNSGWYLTSVISADKKDTISLNYTTYSWTQLSSPYQGYYVQGTDFSIEQPTDTNTAVTTLPLLHSITCRNSRVNFMPGSSARTDLQGTSPSLQEIDVIDSISRDTLKKAIFTYGYFNQTSTNPAFIERLKLKQFTLINPTSSADQQSYNFSYVNEFGTFPGKSGRSVDHWGFYNNLDDNLFGQHTDGFYRAPNFTYCSYAALDTLVYPTGGFTTFQYELNDYDSSVSQPFKAGPGIRVKTISQFLPGASLPASSKNYAFLADNGTSSSGTVSWAQQFSGPMYISDTVDFNEYVMSNNNPGSAVMNNVFYYGKVSEQNSSGKEKHKTDYYFQTFSNVFTDVELNKKIDYRYDSTLSTYSPLAIVTNTYDTAGDSTFISINPYVDSSYNTSGAPTTLVYKYGYTYNYNNTYWKFLANQKVVQYDDLNDSTTTITQFNYNAVRNMDSTRETLPDGRGVIHKFKYPDDYSSGITGNMVAANIIGPVIESQTWLQNTGSGPKMVSGSITSYDQTIFRPVSTYNLEPASPLATLNNETLSGGKYSSLVSDTSNYVLKGQLYYNGNNNLNQYNKTSDINMSYIWGYRHSMPTAEVSNAAANQIAYTSFESDSTGNWSVPDTLRNRTTYITGSQSYSLVTGKTISASVPSGKQYIVSYWSSNGAITVSANGTSISAKPAGLTKSGMTYYEHLLPNTTTSISLTATSAIIDELRLYPVDAQMTTYTYIPLVGKSSVCLSNNQIQYYEYDGFNRLKDVRDMDKNIVKLYDYEYQQSFRYYNIADNGVFYKNNCACGYQASGPTTYKVAANTYVSHAGQSDANQLAQNDIAANGQNYANTNGSCTAIPCGTEANGYEIIYCACQLGTKVYTSSTWEPTLHEFLCTYYWLWTNGAESGIYDEYDHTSCQILN